MRNRVVVEIKTNKYHLRYGNSLVWAARKNRKQETEAERLLWNGVLRKKRLDVKFTRQKPIGRFIVDFYCSELCLAIEVDGGSHQGKKERDNLRDSFLKSCGIKTIRIKNEEIVSDLEKVEVKIEKIIKQLNSLPCQGKE